MKQWCTLYVSLFSYEFVIWPDSFVGHSCPGGICPESGLCHWHAPLLLWYPTRYPTDDWHLANMFSLVYFSVGVCLVGVFSHFVVTRCDPCVRANAPLTLASPLTRKQNRTGGGDPALLLSQARGHLNWCMGLPALLSRNLGCWIF